MLTGRYSGSSESKFDYDIRNISEKGIENFLKEVERAELSDTFWNVVLIQDLTASSVNNSFNVYLAAQCKYNARGFLSKDITIKNLIEHRGDKHHIFPKNFLKKKGLTKRKYNQVANYVYTQSEINVSISNKEPMNYLDELLKQCDTGQTKYGGIRNKNDLLKNFKENDIPCEIFNFKFEDYDEFLDLRRNLIAQKLKRYYLDI